jgi:hypothetical protein
MSTPIHVLRLVAIEERSGQLLVRPGTPRAVTGRPLHPDRLTDQAFRAMELLLEPIGQEERARMGLVIGTAAGSLEVDRVFDRSRRGNPRFASPAAFSRTLPSTVLAELSLHFGLTGPSLTTCSAEAPLALAAYRAARWLEAFDLPCCVAGAIDHLPIGFENPYNHHPVEDPEGTCFVHLWLLSRQPSANGIGTFTVSPRSPSAAAHKVGRGACDLDAEWLLTPRGDYENSQLHFSSCAAAADR